MSISGLLSGLGGAVQLLGMSQRIPQFAAQESYGFQGITVALIGATNPIGCIFAGWFYGAMKYGGNKLTVIQVPNEVVNIIMGTVIIFIAIAPVFKSILTKMTSNAYEFRTFNQCDADLDATAAARSLRLLLQ